jgi:hemerythrin-like domain-containing protein
MANPLKRHEALVAFSRDHHEALLLCWKIKTGISKDIALDRIQAYMFWFWNQYLQTHFEAEEIYIFPLLGMKHPLILQAMTQHKDIKTLCTSHKLSKESLITLATLLHDHIRLEERSIFQTIQEQVSESDLLSIIDKHPPMSQADWHDPFWLKDQS